MLRCVNCSLTLAHPLPRREVRQATDAMVGILRSWILPAILSMEDVLCRECYFILQTASSEASAGLTVARMYGHQQVCFVCGTSILRCKTHKVLPNSPEGNIIMSHIPIQQVHRIKRVCLPCWTNAYRSVRRQSQYDENKQNQILLEAVTMDESMVVPTTSIQTQLISVSETSTKSSNMPIPIPPPLPIYHLYHERNVVHCPKIISHIYKRAAASSRHCIFGECENAERLLVPSVIKEMLLLEHKLYIPPSARICSHHLNNGSWDELEFKYNDFTGLQMDDMMTVMDRASRRQLDFSNIREMNPHLCHYWLGISPEQFYQLLLSIPQLTQEVPCPSVALSIILVKLRTGDTNERLSTLFRLPRSTLERYMAKARNCLGDTFVPLYLRGSS